MSQDDPFAEPGDTERTVIRAAQPPRPPQPRPPGPGQAPVAMPAARQSMAAQATAPSASVGVEAGLSGLNRLTKAAAPLFALVGRVRNRAQHANPEGLRQAVIREIRAFEQRALEAQIEVQQLRIARYLLCATIDDVVLNTPWGGQSAWAHQSMVGTFHKETVGGDRVYDLLKRLEQEPARHRELLEFLYVCLSLGFEGRLRSGVDGGGPEKHYTLRDNLSRLIRTQRGDLDRELSPRWKGVRVPHRPLSAWAPVWLITGVTCGLLVLLFLAFSWLLTGNTERVQGQLAALVLDRPVEFLRKAPAPPPPPPPPPQVVQESEATQLRGFLQPEVEAGLVEVLEDGNTVTVRITGAGMFASASDRLQPRFEDIVQRIGEELAKTVPDPAQAQSPVPLPPVLAYPGKVLVVGHSDGDPIRTARYPNNTVLSLRRAEAVVKRLAAMMTDDQAGRLAAEGRADKEPLVSPERSSADKARNRRIEIVLIK
ncbi:MAG: type IVB secretion system protein IcmH/DotU [Pikeienuella sp.]